MVKVFAIVFLLFGLNGYSQEHPIGIKVGGNVASLSGEGTQELESILNFHAGFFMEIGITKGFAVQPELLFSVYGYRQNEGDNKNVRLNYVVLPIMAKYFISEKFSIEAGPQVGLLLTAKNGKGSLADVKSAFYERDFGLNAGASYKISEKLSASLRYYFGLNDVTAIENKNFNRAFQLALQFRIN